MAANVFKDIKSYLLAHPSVITAIGDRIYIGDFPRHRGKAAPTRMASSIFIRGVGGIVSANLTPFGESRIDIYIFAETYDKANEIDLLIHDILDAINGYGSVNYIDPSAGVYTTEDAEGRRGVFRSYIVHTFRHGRRSD